MGHCIHAIVAPDATANAISLIWPEVPRLDRGDGFSVFPVDENLIDARIAPDKTPTETGHEFMLLTNGFRRLLRSLSSHGRLAYVETEYFGGIGGQGAVVFSNGEEVMAPAWQKHGTINKALRLIGVSRGWFSDRFVAVGFNKVRENDDILNLIASQQGRANNHSK